MTPIALAANVEPWQGMAAIVALAGVVVFLFKWADARVTKAEAGLAAALVVHAQELGRRDVAMQATQAELQAKLFQQAREYAEALRRDQLDSRVHEDALRKEFTATVAVISDQTNKSAEALTDVLGKLHDRFTKSQRQGG